MTSCEVPQIDGPRARWIRAGKMLLVLAAVWVAIAWAGVLAPASWQSSIEFGRMLLLIPSIAFIAGIVAGMIDERAQAGRPTNSVASDPQHVSRGLFTVKRRTAVWWFVIWVALYATWLAMPEPQEGDRLNFVYAPLVIAVTIVSWPMGFIVLALLFELARELAKAVYRAFANVWGDIRECIVD